MIAFRPITLDDKCLYNHYLFHSNERGCEFSFGNVYAWGHQKMAILHDHLVLLSSFYGQSFYPYPLGHGNKKPVLDAILADAKERGIPCRFTGLLKEEKQTLETLYPGAFCFSYDQGSFDYVYDIHDLADLKGRKYHRKRNHLKHFQTTHPCYRIEPLKEETLPLVRQMLSSWYETKQSEHPKEDYTLEQSAIYSALNDYAALDMEGLLLFHKEELLAITLGSRISFDTFDIHFEKARTDVPGAYTAINCEFARYLREKYPEIKYLNREEDMGIPGLRKAKESYFPHHRIEKYRAFLLKELQIGTPSVQQFSGIKNLWKETFDDADEFLTAFYSSAFTPDRSRILTIGKDVIAALYWFDCKYQNRRIAYLYAFAVSEAFRGQGLGRKLLADTHSHLTALGYEGVILVPNGQNLFSFYEKSGYKTCCFVNEFERTDGLPSESGDTAFSLRELTKEEFAMLRRTYLPEHGVIQENENLDFLEAQAKFYAGEDFVMAAYVDELCSKETEMPLAKAGTSTQKLLHCVELLGSTSHASEIMIALGCSKGWFRTPGNTIPFAMYRSLTGDKVLPPKYFGLAFD